MERGCRIYGFMFLHTQLQELIIALAMSESTNVNVVQDTTETLLIGEDSHILLTLMQMNAPRKEMAKWMAVRVRGKKKK